MSNEHQMVLARAAQERDAAFASAERERNADMQAADDKYIRAREKAEYNYAEVELKHAWVEETAAKLATTSPAEECQSEAIEPANAESTSMNRDPLTGTPGSHPVTTAVGATGGAIAGATAGSFAGPVGTAVGGLIGAIVGAVVGHGSGEELNPTADEAYWLGKYANEPYYDPNYGFEDYAPAYRVGAVYRNSQVDRDWDDVEAAIASNWDRDREASRLRWDQARDAVRAGWQREGERL